MKHVSNTKSRRGATEPTVVSKDTWKQLHNNVIYKHTKKNFMSQLKFKLHTKDNKKINRPNVS